MEKIIDNEVINKLYNRTNDNCCIKKFGLTIKNMLN